MSAEARVGAERECAPAHSFRGFYDEHVDRVTALAVAMTADRAAAQDVVQEAFLRAFRDWERIGAYDNPGAWVRTVAANLCRSRWRRFKSEARTLSRLAPSRADYDLREPSVEVWRAVRRLPRRQAAAIALRYVDDLAVEDIAATLDVPVGTTKSDLHRGLKRLAKLLGKEDRR